MHETESVRDLGPVREQRDGHRSASDRQQRRHPATLRSAATRLRDMLPETKAVPKKLAGEVAAAVEKLLAALGRDEEEAA